RIDVAAVNGALNGYEIKSDRDSLQRLFGQINLYGKVLDYAVLVVGERHIVEAVGIVPEWWGIFKIIPDAKTPSFDVLRPGKKNIDQDPRSLVELIWRDEALELLEKRNAIRGFRDKPRPVIWDKVCECYSLEEIAMAVRNCLKARATRKGLQQPS
ncbi:MAG TPA: sce7726 family protein, partial [bacterium]|nr:sce7726 family protein [bacterium]